MSDRSNGGHTAALAIEPQCALGVIRDGMYATGNYMMTGVYNGSIRAIRYPMLRVLAPDGSELGRYPIHDVSAQSTVSINRPFHDSELVRQVGHSQFTSIIEVEFTDWAHRRWYRRSNGEMGRLRWRLQGWRDPRKGGHGEYYAESN